MLTTGRRSRLRLTLGGTAVTALMIGGLVATASGTPAAATVRAGVEKATGIDIATIDAKVAAKLQSTPPAPSAPAPAAEPEGADLPPPPPPPANVAPPQRIDDADVATSDGGTKKMSKRFKIVRVDKDGKAVTEDWVGPINVPDVRSSNCGGGDDRNMVVNKTRGDKRIIIICNDRIERVVTMNKANLEKSGEIQRMAYTHALEGLRRARERVAADERMGAEAKRDALESIDDSIRDMQADMANPD